MRFDKMNEVAQMKILNGEYNRIVLADICKMIASELIVSYLQQIHSGNS